ncbi:MAG: hypothetical protein HQL53_07625 [Magnetococcales bacterium]|nr:hypothetical protein [Magnetococcales bacterium]
MFLNSGLHIDQAPPLSVPLRFFVTAPLFLMLAGAAILYWGLDLLDDPLLPETVATAHLIALGWLAMVMFGALYQMIPVLAGIRVPWINLSAWTHGLLTVGVLLMVLGLTTEIHSWMLFFASMALGPAIGLFLLSIGVAIYRAPAQHPTVTAMGIAILSLIGVLLLGALFLGEYAHGFYDIDRYALLGIHLIWALFGWVGVLLIGVSFQVLPMFYVMPEFPPTEARRVLGGMALSLILLPASLFLTETYGLWVFIPGAAPGIAALILLTRTFQPLFAERKRAFSDPTMQFWMVGLTGAALGTLLLPFWPLVDDLSLRYLFAILFLIGGVSSVMIGMLYKIVPFLVWFHRFSRLAGLVAVPMMDDLLPEKRIAFHPLLHGVAVLMLCLGVVMEWSLMLQLGGLGVMISAGVVLYGVLFALSHHPPKDVQVPDFAAMFENMPKPPVAKQ